MSPEIIKFSCKIKYVLPDSNQDRNFSTDFQKVSITELRPEGPVLIYASKRIDIKALFATMRCLLKRDTCT
jgi:hypothetical protein